MTLRTLKGSAPGKTKCGHDHGVVILICLAGKEYKLGQKMAIAPCPLL
jgi:hypothetical protein